jgi:uncharacterized protein
MGTHMGIERADWPLLVIDRSALGTTGPDALDPIRVQKAMFLLSMRGPRRDLYRFRPYNWGPYSSDLDGDLRSLVPAGLLTTEYQAGRSWPRYRPTDEGHDRATIVAESLGDATVSWVAQARQFVTTRDFATLLNDVYEEFPDFATASLFRR